MRIRVVDGRCEWRMIEAGRLDWYYNKDEDRMKRDTR